MPIPSEVEVLLAQRSHDVKAESLSKVRKWKSKSNVICVPEAPIQLLLPLSPVLSCLACVLASEEQEDIHQGFLGL